MNECKKLTNFLAKFDFWPYLLPEEKEKLIKFSSVAAYKSGSILYGCGDGCLGVIMVISGDVRAYISSEEGKEVTLYRLSPGECCVLSAACVLRQITFDPIMEVKKDSEILVIPADIFDELKNENIYVRCYVYELATMRFSEVVRVLQQLMFKGMEARLAAFLLAESEKNGSDVIVMSQSLIAENINSAREVTTRILGRFEVSGIIKRKRGRVIIEDKEALLSMI